jgi:hypothetical protein
MTYPELRAEAKRRGLKSQGTAPALRKLLAEADQSPTISRGAETPTGRPVSGPAGVGREAVRPADDRGAGDQVPAEAAPVDQGSRRPKRGEFSRSDIERRLIDAHDALAVDQGREVDDAFKDETGADSFDTSFPGALPPEVRDFLEGREHLRRLFKSNVAHGRGPDVMAAMGDRYFERVEELGRSRLAKAKDMADADPVTQFLAFLHDSFDALEREEVNRTVRGKERRRLEVKRPPYNVVDRPDELPDGTKLRIMGKEFEVVVDEESGVPLLVEQGLEATEIPIDFDDAIVSTPDPITFPLSALDSIPVDAGTLQRPDGGAATSRNFDPTEIRYDADPDEAPALIAGAREEMLGRKAAIDQLHAAILDEETNWGARTPEGIEKRRQEAQREYRELIEIQRNQFESLQDAVGADAITDLYDELGIDDLPLTREDPRQAGPYDVTALNARKGRLVYHRHTGEAFRIVRPPKVGALDTDTGPTIDVRPIKDAEREGGERHTYSVHAFVSDQKGVEPLNVEKPKPRSKSAKPAAAPAPGVSFEEPTRKPWEMTEEDLPALYRERKWWAMELDRFLDAAKNDEARFAAELARRDGKPKQAAIAAAKKAERGFSSSAWRDAHRRAVEKAIKDGEPVPSNVLAEYPELAKKPEPPAPPKPVQPWEMTEDEFFQTRSYYKEYERSAGSQGMGQLRALELRERSIKEHREIVLKAIADGKDVPETIRAAYQKPEAGQHSSMSGVAQKGLFGRASDGGITGDQTELFGRGSSKEKQVDPDGQRPGESDEDFAIRKKFKAAEKNTGSMFGDDDAPPAAAKAEPERPKDPPWKGASVDDEMRWYGTRVTVAPDPDMPGSEGFKATVYRVENRGELVSVTPEGQAGTFRVSADRVTIDRLRDRKAPPDPAKFVNPEKLELDPKQAEEIPEALKELEASDRDLRLVAVRQDGREGTYFEVVDENGDKFTERPIKGAYSAAYHATMGTNYSERSRERAKLWDKLQPGSLFDMGDRTYVVKFKREATSSKPAHIEILDKKRKKLTEYTISRDSWLTADDIKNVRRDPSAKAEYEEQFDAEHQERTAEAERDKETGNMFGGGLASRTRSLPAKGAIKHTRIQPAPIMGGKRKNVSEILLDLQRGVGRVRAGVPARGSLGTYYPWTAKTIVKFAGDLDTAAHEVAHRLDDLYGIVGQWARPKKFNKRGVGIPQKSPFDHELRAPVFQQTSGPHYPVWMKRAEGVAEYLRAWMVNPDLAERLAPDFTKWWKQQVPKHVQDRLRAYGDDIRRWSGLPSSQQTLANVRVELPKRGLRRRASDFLKGDQPAGDFRVGFVDKLKTELHDSFSVVYKAADLARKLNGIPNLRPSRDPKILIQNFAGFDAKYSDVLEHGPINARNERVKGVGGMKWLLEPLDSSSPEALKADYEATLALMLSERVVERVDLINKAASELRKLQRERAQLIQAAQSGATMVGNKPIAQRLAEIRKEIKRTMGKVGFKGPEDKFFEWGAMRKQRMSGFGAGLVSDDSLAVDTLQELQKDPKRLARAQEAANRYRDFADAILRYAVQKGRLAPEAYRAIKDSNQFYVSFKRVMEDKFAPVLPEAGKRLASRRDVVKQFKGSTREIENPYVSLIEDAHRIMKESDANEAVRRFVDLLETKPRRGMYQGAQIDLDQIGSIASEGDQGTIKVFRNGEAEYWKFEENIDAALRNWYDLGDTSMIGKVAAAMTQFTKSTITYSPGFIVRNAIRDPVSRAVLSEHKAKPWDQFAFVTPDGIKEYRRALSEFQRHGGGLFGHYRLDKESHYRQLTKAMHEIAGDENLILSLPGKALRGYANFAHANETVGRLAEYRRAYDHARDKLGFDEYDAGLYAANAARQLQDYAQAGRFIRKWNRYVLFLNSMVRGLLRTGQGIQRNPAGFAARWGLYVGLPTIGIKLWNIAHGTDEEERMLPAYRRDLFWNVKVGPEAWLVIPKPWEMGVVASSLSRAIDAARGKDPRAKEYLWSALGSMSPDAGAAAGPMKPFIELITNFDFLSGKPIVPHHEADLELDLRKGTAKSSRASQIIGKTLSVDPRQIDHFIEGQLGGIGRLATAASDIGRDDKPASGALATAGRMSGLVTSFSPYQQADVSEVLNSARRHKLTQRPYMRRLRKSIEDWYAEKDQERRIELMKSIAADAAEAKQRIKDDRKR